MDISRTHRTVGLIILALLVVTHSLIYYNYVPGVIDVWHWALTLLVILPIDGSISEFYGLWSGEKPMAFVVGFLPSVAALLVPIARLGWQPGYGWFVLLGVGMGLMGFGGAKFMADKERKWLVIGFLAWLLFLYMMISWGAS